MDVSGLPERTSSLWMAMMPVLVLISSMISWMMLSFSWEESLISDIIV